VGFKGVSMIDLEIYKREMARVQVLIGANLESKTIKAIYEQISAKYENADLVWALNYIVEAGERLNFGRIKKNLDAAAIMRREKKREQEKRAEARQSQEFWEQYNNIANGDCNYECISCPVRRCPKIARDAIRGIIAILNHKKTLEEVNREMAVKFHGRYPNKGDTKWK